MNEKHTKKLLTEFPNLYQQHSLPKTQTCMCWGFDCDDGWFDLIYDLSKKISVLDPDCQAVQVKEKFGGLRFYTNGTNEESQKIITEYERKSCVTCETCGDTTTAKPRGNYWVKTLCNKCYRKLKISKFIYSYTWRIKELYRKLMGKEIV